MAASAVSVNGIVATVAPTTNSGAHTVQVITPVAVGVNTSFTVVFNASAGLVNSATPAATKTLTLATTIQPSPATSSQFTIDAASALSAANVTVTPSTVNTIAQYGISFTLGSSTGLTTGNTITIDFPDGTSVPTTIAPSLVSVYDDGVKISDPSSVTTDPATGIVTITIPGSTSISVSSVVNVVFDASAGLTNPSAAGNSYTLTSVAATNNGSTQSNVYAITASSTIPATVTVSPTTESVQASYTIAFTTGAGGALSAGVHAISFTFPSGTTIPSTIAANKVTVNGTALSIAPTCNVSARTIDITTPVSVGNAGRRLGRVRRRCRNLQSARGDEPYGLRAYGRGTGQRAVGRVYDQFRVRDLERRRSDGECEVRSRDHLYRLVHQRER